VHPPSFFLFLSHTPPPPPQSARNLPADAADSSLALHMSPIISTLDNSRYAFIFLRSCDHSELNPT
jgi:hypothetical protein